MDGYYYITDLQVVGKIENYVPYLYESKDKGWVVDNKNIIMDRLMGYDTESIGNTSELEKIEEISEAKAKEIIKATKH